MPRRRERDTREGPSCSNDMARASAMGSGQRQSVHTVRGKGGVGSELDNIATIARKRWESIWKEKREVENNISLTETHRQSSVDVEQFGH